MKSLPEEQRKEVKSIAGKDAFSDFTAKRMKAITVEEKDKRLYDDMMERLEARTFLPKQKDGDNRVIPQQLYHYELAELLKRAKGVLQPFERDRCGRDFRGTENSVNL